MLQVCVRGKADDLHESQVKAKTREPLRVQWQTVLEDEDDEGEAHLENIQNDSG